MPIHHKTILSTTLVICLIGLIEIAPYYSVNAVSSNSPSSRYGHKMVYDSKNNVTILFGGDTLNNVNLNLKSTWKYSSQTNTWFEISNPIAPSARICHNLVYNLESGKILLFGGMEISSYSRLNDMWEFDSLTNNWTELHPANTPSARSHHAMLYDLQFNVVVLFGGYLANDQLSSETWIYNCSSSEWYQISPILHPTKRYGHVFVYDEFNKLGVFFGGRDVGLMSETWFFNTSTLNWYEQNPVVNPLQRYLFDMVYNPNEMNFVLFGGDNEQSIDRALDDTWIFNTNDISWAEKFTSQTPKARNNHAMVFDKYLNKTLLFGGLGEDYTKTYGDFWSYDSLNNEWTQISIIGQLLWWPIALSVSGAFAIIVIVLAVLLVRRKKRT
ncbi:MAG: hypothetical protein FK734_20280 [Asgard group archaeon]|nr:hypothetical protein [Asgard group archaeon]